ncbi:hypothetical protein [Lacticaseibacillus rhamnosus]|jgi:hypothetical protein|uniref:hypothetical protein n=1 Tax=Lacticaseibacillus rhamnosus TaxID=47715 RepID=UPI000A52318B|nr:hypothetical protein [Lacticaseibacillus rhamnosus]QOX84798.1 hypothetical protein GM657_12150 [Lacticaseibacillus rhamnosus GG]UZW77721.1 hypothetical protein MUB25_11620 [Lacticaseibacillus rhamnosus]WNP41874.1 hypothetical protein RMQ71_10820 [Lacticaseibacillus rhamnosus]
MQRSKAQIGDSDLHNGIDKRREHEERSKAKTNSDPVDMSLFWDISLAIALVLLK